MNELSTFADVELRCLVDAMVIAHLYLRCGSVIVDLVLRFNQSVSANDVITDLKNAAQQTNFGGFIVDPESIKQTSPSSTASPSPSLTGTSSTQGIVEVWLFYFEQVPIAEIVLK